MYELNIPLKEGSVPYYQQIYSFIVNEIRSGALPPTTKMPSTRVLAANLGISRSTTQYAYDQLLAEGYLESIPCSGYYIAEVTSDVIPVQDKVVFDRSEEKKSSEEETAWVCDFSPRGVDVELFPHQIWRKLYREILDETLFNAGDSQGEMAFRRALARYLHSARGVNCCPEQIIVGAGNEYLLLLLSQILGGPQTIAMENPTYKQAYRVFERAGYDVRPVMMDAYGMSMKGLEASGADLAYVMPSHQYPTGIVMPIRRRMELLTWAKQGKERYLIEDDYDSEFRYRGKPIPALQGVDREDKVIYIGTFSRSIAPAIRVSYMVLPEKLLSRYRERCDFYASTVSRVDQHMLTRFLSEGYLERHLNKMRKRYRMKHDALLDALAPLRDVMEIHGEEAGIHLLVTSKCGKSEACLVEEARRVGVKVYGMSRNHIGELTKKEPGTVILGYANCKIDEIRMGARSLCEAWH
ncbi:MAG: PLP-dependent aminotransferase family protein [Lachnospiraceae bacterium]|nr:PLP-dependent aminotransferase family protein [Lachnospiraceae bacterium]